MKLLVHLVNRIYHEYFSESINDNTRYWKIYQAIYRIAVLENIKMDFKLRDKLLIQSLRNNNDAKINLGRLLKKDIKLVYDFTEKYKDVKYQEDEIMQEQSYKPGVVLILKEYGQ